VTLRQSGTGPFVSDNHGYILDCFFGKIDDPAALERQLAAVTGVMESGLFVRMAERALLGDGESVRTIQPAP
jgi:ribose 5-phosphate isomerase A